MKQLKTELKLANSTFTIIHHFKEDIVHNCIYYTNLHVSALKNSSKSYDTKTIYLKFVPDENNMENLAFFLTGQKPSEMNKVNSEHNIYRLKFDSDIGLLYFVLFIIYKKKIVQDF
jgi:hypothetical protein